jgi:hypothetical protein
MSDPIDKPVCDGNGASTPPLIELRQHPVKQVTVSDAPVYRGGHYIHTADAGAGNDVNFQRFGHLETARIAATASAPSGQCRIPAARRISVKLQKGGRALMTIQIYV